MPWNLVAIIFVVLGLAAGGVVLVLRHTRKTSYRDYLRRKYYNL